MTKAKEPKPEAEEVQEEQVVPSWVVGQVALALAKANRHTHPEDFAAAVVRAHEGEEPHPEEDPVDLIGDGESAGLTD